MRKQNYWLLGASAAGVALGYFMGKRSAAPAPAGQGQLQTQSAQQWTNEHGAELSADIVLRELGITPRQWLLLPHVVVLPVFGSRSRTDIAYYVQRRFGVGWPIPTIVTWIDNYAYANLPRATVIPIFRG